MTEEEIQSSKLKAQRKLQGLSAKCCSKNAFGKSIPLLSRRDRMTIARRFNAGNGLRGTQVPKGRPNEREELHFDRPFGTRSVLGSIPALKRWAIVDCPSGTTQAKDTSNFRKAFPPVLGTLSLVFPLSFELYALSFSPA
jgi:hypothetical protein